MIPIHFGNIKQVDEVHIMIFTYMEQIPNEYLPIPPRQNLYVTL